MSGEFKALFKRKYFNKRIQRIGIIFDVCLDVNRVPIIDLQMIYDSVFCLESLLRDKSLISQLFKLLLIPKHWF